MSAQDCPVTALKVQTDEEWRLLLLASIVQLCEEADAALLVRDRSVAPLVAHPSLDVPAAMRMDKQLVHLRHDASLYITCNTCINTNQSVLLFDHAWHASRIECTPIEPGSLRFCAWSGHAATTKCVFFGNGTYLSPQRTEHAAYIDDRWLMFTHALRTVGNLDGMLRQMVSEAYFDSKLSGSLRFDRELVLTNAQKDARVCYNLAVDVIASTVNEQGDA